MNSPEVIDGGSNDNVKNYDFRAEVVDILEKIICGQEGKKRNPRKTRLIGALINGGYLDGVAVPDENGVIANNVVTGITIEGYLLYQKLKREIYSESFRGRFGSGMAMLGSAFLGAVASPVIQCLWSILPLTPAYQEPDVKSIQHEISGLRDKIAEIEHLQKSNPKK